MKYLFPFIISIILAAGLSSYEDTWNPGIKNANTTAKHHDNDYWILFENDDRASKHVPFGYISGYVNRQGDTMIAADKYARCYTDTFYHYAIIFDSKRGGFIGINKQEEKLFNAVQTGDAYFVEEADGMIMIQEKGKYGFANRFGEVVIQPQYNCACNFQDGKAKVSNDCSLSPESDSEHRIMQMNSWFYIDKTGKRLN